MREPIKTRETLLDTAIQLIWQSNYHNVGVNEICARAGVTKGAFYHHFESKADLYYAAAGHYWEELKKELDAIYSPSLTPLENLEKLIKFVVDRQGDKHIRCDAADGEPLESIGCPFFACGGQVGVGEEKVRQASIDMAENGIRYYAALVRGLKADGVLRGDPDPSAVGRLLFQYMQGVLIYARVLNSIAAVEADLREGFYRLLDLKPEYRRKPVPELAPAAD